MQNRLIQTSQTGGQQYSDTSPCSIPWFCTFQLDEKKVHLEGEDEGSDSQSPDLPPVKLTLKLEKPSTGASFPPINPEMTSEELISVCEASCTDDGEISTSVFLEVSSAL